MSTAGAHGSPTLEQRCLAISLVLSLLMRGSSLSRQLPAGRAGTLAMTLGQVQQAGQPQTAALQICTWMRTWLAQRSLLGAQSVAVRDLGTSLLFVFIEGARERIGV